MDWNDFFEKTRVAADVPSMAKLAPLIGVTDGAISHYRVGRSVPEVWTVAECLRIQGHPTPEKAAIQIMKAAARTSPERAFWRKLAAAAGAVVLLMGMAQPARANALHSGLERVPNYTLCEIESDMGSA